PGDGAQASGWPEDHGRLQRRAIRALDGLRVRPLETARHAATHGKDLSRRSVEILRFAQDDKSARRLCRLRSRNSRSTAFSVRAAASYAATASLVRPSRRNRSARTTWNTGYSSSASPSTS